MNRLKQIQWLLGAIVFASASTGLQVFAEDQATGIEFFESRIRPVLVEHCYQCHSSDSKSLKGGLLLDTRDGIRAGGDSGHAVDLGSVGLLDSIPSRAFRVKGQHKRFWPRSRFRVCRPAQFDSKSCV